MKPKNCLIFGGSGQIGSFLIRKLTKNNIKVTVVTRNVHQKGLKIKTQGNAGFIDIKEVKIFEENKIEKLFSEALQPNITGSTISEHNFERRFFYTTEASASKNNYFSSSLVRSDLQSIFKNTQMGKYGEVL